MAKWLGRREVWKMWLWELREFNPSGFALSSGSSLLPMGILMGDFQFPLVEILLVAFRLIHHIQPKIVHACSVMSNSLQPHRPQHARPPCPSPTPRVHPNSCPLSQWCQPTISSSVVPFSSCLQSFPAWGPLQLSQFFTTGGQSIGVSASASILQMNIQDWFLLGWTGWISWQSKGLSRVFFHTTFRKHQFFGTQLSFSPTLTSIHDYWKNHSFE